LEIKPKKLKYASHGISPKKIHTSNAIGNLPDGFFLISDCLAGNFGEIGITLSG
jgi:hypothetical protein